jgi:hypothetical protein
MNNEPFDRITHNPAVMEGKACIRGMRITVSRIISQLGAGETIEELPLLTKILLTSRTRPSLPAFLAGTRAAR